MNGWKQWSEQVSTSSFLEKKAAESLAREGLEGFQALGKDEVGGSNPPSSSRKSPKSCDFGDFSYFFGRNGVGQAENTGRISCRMPVFSSCCFAQVTRVTSPTNRRSFFRRIIAGCQTADKHQIAALCRPYSLQWRRKIIDLLK